MTVNALVMLLHYYNRSDAFHTDLPWEVRMEATELLHRNGLTEIVPTHEMIAAEDAGRPIDGTKITARGRAYVKSILETPLPN
jgi:hypothetical protein